MGVKGLETFLDKTEAASQKVALQELVNQYKSISDEPPVVVVDAMSIFRFIYGDLSWINGGQLKEFKEKVEIFVQKWTHLGCHMVFFLDGPMQDKKLPEWRRRRYSAAERIAVCIDMIYTGNKTTDEIESDTNEVLSLPNGLGAIFNVVVSQAENCKLIISINECDDEVVCYTRKHKCFAILGQDSDYVIHNCTEHYFSMKNLDLETMTAVTYNGTSLARHLGLKDIELPLLASLNGNDYTSYEDLQFFVKKLWQRYGKYKGRGNINKFKHPEIRNHKIYKISEFIKENRNKKLYDITYYVFGNKRHNENYRLLLKSVESYRITSVKDYPERYSCPDENWKKILEQVKKIHTSTFWPSQLYDIVIFNRFTSSCCFEDYRSNHAFSPSAQVLMELRIASYGVLLHEKPTTSDESNYVNELVMSGFDSLTSYKKVLPKYLNKTVHPGLLKLWNCKDKQTEETKWDILSEIFNLPKIALKNLPTRLLVPVLCVKYLISQIEIQQWEINAILSCAICVQDYSGSDLSRLEAECINYRSVWLYTILTRGYSLVLNLINYLGQFIPLSKIIISEYSDGKLFHKKYNMSKTLNSEQSIDSLCEHKVHNIETFNQLKELLKK